MDRWDAADAYEPYVGRWSVRIAERFLDGLAVPPGSAWLDVGCGTGALSSVIATRSPAALTGIDRSPAYVGRARARVAGAAFQVGDATRLPFADRSFDAVVSGLVLNFVPDPVAMASEMARVSRAVVAAYVWDYADGMRMMRVFWDVAVELDPSAATLDEGARFPLCRPGPLEEVWRAAGLGAVRSEPVEVTTRFADFDDYWTPFLGGQGPAPSYAISLDVDARERLRETIRGRLPVAGDGSIELTARAWAVVGRCA